MRKTGTLVVRAQHGDKAKIVIPGLLSSEAATTFITSIESAFMTGKVMTASYSETVLLSGEIPAGNTDRKAVIVYQDNVAGVVKRISIPSWGTEPGDSELTPDGERVPYSAVASVVSALETATGGDLTPISGYIIQKK